MLQSPRISVRAYESVARSHSHAHHQIVAPLRGRLEMEIGSRVGAVSASRAAVVPAGEAHGFFAREANAFLIVDVPVSPLDAAQAAVFERAANDPFPVLDAGAIHLTRYLAGAIRVGAPVASTHRAALLVEALAGLDASPAPDRRIEKVLSVLEERIAEPLDMRDVAADCGLSESRLHLLFRRETGTTPAAYLRDRRIAMSMQLLRDTALPVSAIAERCGYREPAAFARAFRRVSGVTPRMYRVRGDASRGSEPGSPGQAPRGESG